MGSVESGPIHSSQVVRFSHMSTSCLISCEEDGEGGEEGREGGREKEEKGREKEGELKEGVKKEERGRIEGKRMLSKQRELFCYSCLANTCTSMENSCI